MKKFMYTALSVGMMAMAGTAFAQSDRGKSMDSQPGGKLERSAPSTAPGATGAGSSSGGAGMDSGMASAPPAGIEGKDVVGPSGDDIGQIEKVEGNTVIVGVGGFLGLGERKVALPWNKLSMTGTGEDAKITTSMTKDQLKKLPEYKDSKAGTTGGAGRPAGTMK